MQAWLALAARGRTAWWRYGVTVILALVFAMGGGAMLLVGLDLAGVLPPDLERRLTTPDDPVGFLIGNGLLFALILAAFAAAIGVMHAKSPADVAGPWRGRQFLAGAGVWTLAVAGVSLIDLAIAPAGFAFTGDARTWPLFLAALPALAVQTFAEEFLFRGYVTQAILLALRRPWPTALLSGLVFGAVHIPNGWPQAASAVVFGVVLAMVAMRTGGLSFTFGLHLANNLFAAVVLVSGGDVFRGAPGLFTQSTPHLMWWDAVLGSLALVLVAAYAIRRWGERSATSSP